MHSQRIHRGFVGGGGGGVAVVAAVAVPGPADGRGDAGCALFTLQSLGFGPSYFKKTIPDGSHM